MFLTLWDYVREKATEDYDAFRPPELPEIQAPGFVQPYTDNPLDCEAVGQAVYLNLINKARRIFVDAHACAQQRRVIGARKAVYASRISLYPWLFPPMCAVPLIP